MGAAESVDRKSLHRRKQLVGDLARHSVRQAAVDELVFERRHLDPVEVACHRPAEAIRATWRHARDIHRDLDDLLLVEDHPERVLEDRLEQRVRVGDDLTTLLATDVGMDRVALDRSGPDDRHLDDQVVERLRPGAWQGLHLRPGLDLEHADRVRFAAQLVDRGVVQRQLVEVGADTGRVLDQLQRLGHDRECAEAEHVHLDQAQVLDVVLVELDDAPPLHRRRLDRRDVHQRLAGHEHAAVVDRQMTWKLDDLATQLEKLLPALRPHVRRRHRPLHRVFDVLGEPAVDAFGQAVEQLG